MRAMILAAGLGTRLRPLTNDRPKALVEIAGHTLLEITLCRLRDFGISEVIINVHHFADRVQDYLQAKRNFGMRIEVSREEVLLDTGGGLKKAAWFFLEHSDREEAFLVHNVDVLSTIDLGNLVRFHNRNQALATLAVQDRETSRYLLFDDRLRLCGRRAGREGEAELVRPVRSAEARAFTGIHVISPRIFARITQAGVFSIIDSYLSLSKDGESILAFPADGYYWRDLGRPENVAQAVRDLEREILRSPARKG